MDDMDAEFEFDHAELLMSPNASLLSPDDDTLDDRQLASYWRHLQGSLGAASPAAAATAGHPEPVPDGSTQPEISSAAAEPSPSSAQTGPPGGRGRSLTPVLQQTVLKRLMALTRGSPAQGESEAWLDEYLSRSLSVDPPAIERELCASVMEELHQIYGEMDRDAWRYGILRVGQ